MALIAAFFDVVPTLHTEIAIFLFAICIHTVIFRSYSYSPRKQKKTAGAHSPTSKPDSASAKQPPQLVGSRDVPDAARGTQAQNCQSEASTDGISNNAELLAAVQRVLRESGVEPGAVLDEQLLLQSSMASQLHKALAELEVDSSTTAAVAGLALHSTTGAGDLESSRLMLQTFAAELRASANADFVPRLLHLAAEQDSLPAVARELASCGLLSPSVVEIALEDSAPKADVALELEALARAEGVELTDKALAQLIRCVKTTTDALRVFKEAAARGPVGQDVSLAALSRGLTEVVARHLPQQGSAELALALLRSLAESRGKDSAVLKTYEGYLLKVDVLGEDLRLGRLVAEAALRRKRLDLLGRVLTACDEPSRRVALLKSFAADGRLADATAVFHTCSEKSPSLYNALLDACVGCQDLQAAEQVLKEAVGAGAADVVTYNTIIKKHLQRGHVQQATAVIESMRAAGGNLAPNSVTFNELIDATIQSNAEGAWVLIDEMKACGLQPTSVTCSILLKSIQWNSKAADVERTMAFVNELEDAMDEVLLSSMCEACIRAGRMDLLARQMQRQRGSKGVQVNGAHTFGSIIRAYGFLKDLSGVRAAWQQMRSQNIVPTSITIGCMVEALVSNGDPEGGYQLIRGLAADKQTRPLLNAIVYCSVLKGFSHQKAFDRVWAVYQEMREEKLEFSIVTYNALIDACARGCEMARVRALLEDMSAQHIEPNLVTYSTIIKGYCQEGRLEKAFDLLEAMKKSQKYQPDEITYNTVIDGCAQRGLFEQGMSVLEQMQSSGVPPSTFTLSVLVKLANRGKRPDRAFELVDELSRRHRLQLNVHVYNNLLHACTAHGELKRAFEVTERMARQRVRPDKRTYTLLLRGCIEGGELQQAVAVVRAACGLQGSPLPAHLRGLQPLQSRDSLPSEVVQEVLEAVTSRPGEERLGVQLLKDLRSVHGLKLDPKFSMGFASKVIRGAA